MNLNKNENKNKKIKYRFFYYSIFPCSATLKISKTTLKVSSRENNARDFNYFLDYAHALILGRKTTYFRENAHVDNPQSFTVIFWLPKYRVFKKRVKFFSSRIM